MNPRSAPEPTAHVNVAVIGAGPAGLTAGLQLARAGKQVTVLEAGKRVGGMAGSTSLWEHTVDFGPHRFFSRNARVTNFWREIAGDDFTMVDRKTRILFDGELFSYPLEPRDALLKLGLGEAALSAGSYALRNRNTDSALQNLETWLVSRFGQRLYGHFFKGYSEKLWGLPCSEIDSDFAAQRIRGFSLGEAIRGAFNGGGSGHKTTIDQFAYPIHGSGMIYDRMAEEIKARGGQILLNSPVADLNLERKQVEGIQLADGTSLATRQVISTMPLTHLVKSTPSIPESVRANVEKLRYRNTVLVYLRVHATDLFGDQWIYINSPKLQVGRVTNFSNWGIDDDSDRSYCVLALEFWCSEEEQDWSRPDEEWVELAKQQLDLTGLAKGAAVTEGRVIRIPRCYPVYTLGYKKALDPIEKALSQFSALQVIGRYGSFKYNNQDHSIHMGLLAADNIIHGTDHDLWAVNSDYDEYQEHRDPEGGPKEEVSAGVPEGGVG